SSLATASFVIFEASGFWLVVQKGLVDAITWRDSASGVLASTYDFDAIALFTPSTAVPIVFIARWNSSGLTTFCATPTVPVPTTNAVNHPVRWRVTKRAASIRDTALLGRRQPAQTLMNGPGDSQGRVRAELFQQGCDFRPLLIVERL